MSQAAADTNNLSLYQTDWCPFCVRVRQAIDALGIAIELRDIGEDGAHRDALVGATGKEMVPCLRIDAPSGEPQWLHESADIVSYLQRRFS